MYSPENLIWMYGSNALNNLRSSAERYLRTRYKEKHNLKRNN